MRQRIILVPQQSDIVVHVIETKKKNCQPELISMPTVSSNVPQTATVELIVMVTALRTWGFISNVSFLHTS